MPDIFVRIPGRGIGFGSGGLDELATLEDVIAEERVEERAIRRGPAVVRARAQIGQRLAR
jgi:hypothetical protein